MRDEQTFGGSAVRRFDGSGIRRHGGSRTTEPSNGRTVKRFSPETQAALAAAQAAGDLLLARVGRFGAVQLKSAKDPVTEADAAAERCIRRLLHRQFPRIGFLGEEGGAAEGPDGRWIVDPLDGTIGFVAGLPIFSVLIALERRGTLESSVTYVPCLGESFVAERGRGAWLNGRRIAVSQRRRLAETIVALWHDDSVWGNRPLRERIAALALRVRNVQTFGAGFALAGVAAGRLDGYWEEKISPWDVAAGVLLVQEAGGAATAYDGRPADIRSRQILASNGLIHGEMSTILLSQDPG